jgi:type I restriction enzyme S subunit
MNFPTQWTVAQLGDLTIRIVGGGTPSKALSANFEGAIPFMTVKDMKARFVGSTVDHISEEAIRGSATTMVPADTLIVATRMSLGKIVRPKFDVAINQDLKALFLEEEVEKTYIEYFWRSKSQAIQAMGTGTTVKGIRLEDIRTLAVPLAPKNEQKRIVDKLDTVLTRVDAVNTRLARVTPLLKRFRQSVLAAATSGRLVGAVKQDASKFIPVVLSDSQRGRLPDSWSWRPITELARLESGHTPRKSVPEYWDGGSVPWLSLQDIRGADGRVISETKLKPTMLGIDNSSARLLPAGTVCFCRDISFGYVTIMGREMATSQHFVNWVCGAELNPLYLMFALMAARDSLSMSGQGTTVTTMYMPALKVLQLATPPIEVQTEIVRRVETLFAFADRLEARLQAAQTAADRLTPSLLAKAFRGELVPQDPNDEPASELLNRLTNRVSKPDKRR